MDFNQQQYEKHAHNYIQSNTTGEVGGSTPAGRAQLLKRYLPEGKTIFEIGSGNGLDSKVLIESGYRVTASDFTVSFVEFLKKEGLPVVFFDAKKDILPEEYDAIYANAVFIHFSPEEMKQFLLNNKSKLKNEKILFFTVLKGLGHHRGERNEEFERDYYYYNIDFLEHILSSAGFRIVHKQVYEDNWIQVIATTNS